MVVMTVTNDQRSSVREIADRIGLDFVVLYGSKTNGRTRIDSDLDIAVLARQRPDATLFRALFQKFSDIFPDENVDLRFLNDADPLFLMQVVKNGILLVGDPDRYNDFKALTNRRYIDDGMTYFPSLNLHLKAQQQFLKGAKEQ